MEFLIVFVQIVIVAAILIAATMFANGRLIAYYESRPHLKFRRQLLQLGGVLVAVLFVILFMPFTDQLRGQLLNLYGLIISATIALSSTTLVGNIMAGIMLKMIGNCRPGNYITVGDYFGRITEMDLLHIEIQTEERDLTTLPNLFFLTNPVRVMRTSGTMLAVELSLGYDVSRHDIERILISAAEQSGLESPFVQIRDLGDHSVTYRISGLLKDINRLIDKRRELRGRTIDMLHADGIEIVSPSFMNTRAYTPQDRFLSKVPVNIVDEVESSAPEAIIFDKAEKAQSVEKLREELEAAHNAIKDCDKRLSECAADDEKSIAGIQSEKDELTTRAERLKAIIDRKEVKMQEGS